MNMISWKKWIDPLGRNANESDYMPEENVKYHDINDTDEEEWKDEKEGPDSHIPVVITPLGMIPLKSFNNPARTFNFWLGETNFSINTKVVDILQRIPGVEILDVFTRYKFRISVGNNFKSEEVRRNIEVALGAIRPQNISNKSDMELTPEIDLKIKQTIQLQLTQYPHWAIYVFPNGQIDYTFSKDESEDFKEKLELYNETKKMVGGKVIYAKV
jgi:hypothetical protein